MRIGRDYTAVWSPEDGLDPHEQSKMVARYVERLEDALEKLGVTRKDGTYAAAHEEHGREEVLYRLDDIEHEDYDAWILDEVDINYHLEDDGHVHFKYSREAAGDTCYLAVWGDERVGGTLEDAFEVELDQTVLGAVREWLGR